MSITNIITNNNKIILLLLEEEDDDELLITRYKKRQKVNDLFINRKTEGFFEILINRHLSNDETKFREFFRVNKIQFDYLLSLVEVELSQKKLIFPYCRRRRSRYTAFRPVLSLVAPKKVGRNATVAFGKPVNIKYI